MAGITNDLVALYVESDALALAAHLRRGDVTAVEIAEVAIRLIEAVDPHLNTIAIQTLEFARESAAEPARGAFSGVPFLLKNVGSTCAGLPLDLGLACLRGLQDSVDTEMVRRIRAAGFVILGRTNAPECGWSIGTENRLYGATRNPYDLSRTSGGSSGGAAAAVASRLVPLAEGSDGAGSIRVPASCCGVVGLKPSRGRITDGPERVDPWFGSVYTLCNSRTVRDTAAFLDLTAGPMVGDPYNPPRPETPWLDLIDCPTGRLRIGFTLAASWGGAVDAEVAASVRQTLAMLEGLGHEILEYDLHENLEAAWWVYNDVVAVEYARDFRAHGERIGRPLGETDLCPFNWAMLEHAQSLSASEYSTSIAAIRKSGQRLARELAPFDVFVTPTLTQQPRPLHYWSMEEPDFRTYLRRWSDAAYMFPFNISGLPAISVPGMPSAGGLPIGTQLVGRYGDEATILQVGRQLELAAPWVGHKPMISA